MNLRRIVSMMMTVLLVVGLFGCTNPIRPSKEVKTEEQEIAPVSMKEWMQVYKGQLEQKEITCWYTDETDKSWLESAASKFKKEYDLDVHLVFYDGVQLFEDLNQENQAGKGPDLYLTGNDQIELAVTTALAEETDGSMEFWKVNYPQVAIEASAYKGKQYGYPVYYDTYCLVYDANLLSEAPASIEDILTFADAYEDTGSTKAIFRWDVADPYVNTMFLNSYANLFGENGDDANVFQINNKKSIEAMEYFQSLSAYLWMNKKNISHDTIKKRIYEKNLVLGLCKSDIMDTLTEMKAEKEKTEQEKSKKKKKKSEESDADKVDYQISYVPSLTKELSSTVFSTTYSAFVNPYALNSVGAKMFAMYLSLGQMSQAGDGPHKLSVVKEVESLDEMESVFYAQYLNSKPVPKVMILGDYLSESAIAFDAIWEGKDVKEQLDQLQERMETKIGK